MKVHVDNDELHDARNEHDDDDDDDDENDEENLMTTNGMRHDLILFYGSFQNRPDDSRSNWIIQASDGF